MISTKKIGEISEDTLFFIPDYQRGYKWNTIQVKQLITDIIQFEKTSQNNLNHSYCLQPIVLKQMDGKDERLKSIKNLEIGKHNVIYELIDGQQRLTTTFLLLAFLNQRFKPEFANKKFQLFYQSRPKSLDFLDKLGKLGLSEDLKKESAENIDFHHIYQAYEFIYSFFSVSKNIRNINLFESTLLFRTKFIWYKVDENENSTANEIFRRLNSGKIELSNAELIKALFLGNFDNNISDSERIQMSIEWDWIENKLNQNKFWYFLSNKDTEKNNRITFILETFAEDLTNDLIDNTDFKRLNKDDERYVFLVYNDLLSKKNNIKEIWIRLKQKFRVIHNWYTDHELFHYIGFLMSNYVGEKIGKIFDIYKNYDTSIDNFKKSLLEEIDEHINVHKIEDLHYHKNSYQIRKVLLWFNISMMVKDENQNQRFNFYKFKYLNFDLEHIKSLDSEITKSDQSKNEFLLSFFNHYSNFKFEDVNNEEKITETNNIDNGQLLTLIYRYLRNQGTNNFSAIYKQIKKSFDILDSDFDANEDHSIGNLCLLDQGTNRGYKNDIFPIKRQKIINKDLQGVYILPMTKSAFLKQFSGKTKNLLVWTDEDSNAYKEQIIDVVN